MPKFGGGRRELIACASLSHHLFWGQCSGSWEEKGLQEGLFTPFVVFFVGRPRACLCCFGSFLSMVLMVWVVSLDRSP
jgi:hypothetical protein